MKSIRVVNRNGESHPFNVSKIRTVVSWACHNLSASPLALESKVTAKIRDGITTREIQDNLIYCALEMCSLQEPDWRFVAGRLHIWSLREDVAVSRGFGYDVQIFSEWMYGAGDYWESARIGTKYDKRLFEYSVSEIKTAYSWICPALDLDYDYAGAVLLSSRYLLKDELPQEAFLLCALLLALPEKPANRMQWAKRFYEAIAKRYISLATPILANLRIPDGSLSSCFILALEDNLESIFKGITDTARISKNGGGVGVNISRVRATGSWVMGKANASGGVIPWIKLLNDTAIAVNQGGRRAGAVTVGLDIWHLDVPEFLEIQAENGDQRRKAYDIFPQLVIPDLFMRRVQNDENWTLVDPYEIRQVLGVELAELWGGEFEAVYQEIEDKLGNEITLYKSVKAKDLFKTIMRSQLETGLPYLAFKDTINRANPNQHEGYIPGVNLCVESFSNVSPGQLTHCCNLVSLNLAQMGSSEILRESCGTAVRILDNTIELTSPPIIEAANHNNRYRTIGVGCMGLADWLAKRQLRYENIALITQLFEQFAYYCIDASCDLAGERGAYPAYQGSMWEQGYILGKQVSSSGYHNVYWPTLYEKIQQHGIRNSHIMAIAPNTSSSLIQGCTASVLPVFSHFFLNKAGKEAAPVAPPFIADFLWHYQQNKYLDQNIVVEAVAAIQQWIDTGISMELLFNLNQGAYSQDGELTARDIYDVLTKAWKLGCKAIYYVRSVQKDSFKESCSTCAN